MAWSEIAPDIDEIDLIVAPTVITEIERHKQKGNSRTAKRAREASALLRKALQSTDQKTVVRSASPKVHLALPPVFAVQFENSLNSIVIEPIIALWLNWPGCAKLD